MLATEAPLSLPKMPYWQTGFQIVPKLGAEKPPKRKSTSMAKMAFSVGTTRRRPAPRRLSRAGVHMHVPAGAVPKDGPSAGVAMVTALASLFSNISVRSDTAMTGEITLAGLVLPIGGVKEKVLAARRAGLKRVILPRDNDKDARELPDNVKKEREVIFAERIDDVLAAALPQLRVSTLPPPAPAAS